MLQGCDAQILQLSGYKDLERMSEYLEVLNAVAVQSSGLRLCWSVLMQLPKAMPESKTRTMYYVKAID